MTDFDPDTPLDTQEAHDAYVKWCADQFREVMVGVEEGDIPNHLVTSRAASWLWVASVAPIHLDDDCDLFREQHLTNLARSFAVARDTERSKPGVGLRDWLVARAVLDCYTPSGRMAGYLLDAGKCAVSSLILTESHPLNDLGDVLAPDAWGLLVFGAHRLNEINLEEGLPPDAGPLEAYDFAVLPDQTIIDKMNWQKVNNAARQMGAPPVSPN